jgi:hypothetical protein
VSGGEAEADRRIARLRQVQRAAGLACLVLFFGTGWVMLLHRPPMDAVGLGSRLQMRSGHIFLMFAGLLNVVLPLCAAPGRRRGARWLGLGGSVLCLVAIVPLALGFFLESSHGMVDRPLTSLGIFTAFAGTLLYVLAVFLAPTAATIVAPSRAAVDTSG